MLKDTAKRQFSVIILWKVDRFGRNREEIAINKMKCRKNGVRVEYVAETIPDSPEGVILESVLEGFAEYYSLQLCHWHLPFNIYRHICLPVTPFCAQQEGFFCPFVCELPNLSNHSVDL